MASAMATDNEVPTFGPKMLALTAKQQGFVSSLYDEDAPLKGEGLLIWAVKKAGYDVNGNKSASAIANRLVHDDKVLAAISEFSQRIVRAISPEAVRAVRNAIGDPKHNDHIRAAAMVLDRSDPIETTHNVKVERRSDSNVSVAEVMKEIRKLAREAGVVIPAPKIIEGTCETVAESPQ